MEPDQHVSGRAVATAMSITGSEEVLVARYRVRRENLVQPGEHLLLQIQVLGNGFEDEVAASQSLEARAPEEMRPRIVSGVVLRQPVALHRPGFKLRPILSFPASTASALTSEKKTSESRPCHYLADAGTHGAAPTTTPTFLISRPT